MIDFNKMVSLYLAKEQRKKQIGRYYPSEIGNCIRKIWYGYKFPQEIDPELLKIFELGNMLHDFVVDVLKSEKNDGVELLQSELPFKIEEENFLISGRIDDLILVKESGKKLLVEVKSTKSLDYTSKASMAHAMQLQLYMHATGVHEGVVLYIDKNNLQSKVFSVDFSKEEVEKIINRFTALHNALTAGLLPVPEAKQRMEMNWLCRFCEYSEKCEANDS